MESVGYWQAALESARSAATGRTSRGAVTDDEHSATELMALSLDLAERASAIHRARLGSGASGRYEVECQRLRK